MNILEYTIIITTTIITQEIIKQLKKTRLPKYKIVKVIKNNNQQPKKNNNQKHEYINKTYIRLKKNENTGTKRNAAKLTSEQVQRIKDTKKEFGCTNKILADEYGVCAETISRIINGRTYKKND